jgi:hypothetical protein
MRFMNSSSRRGQKMREVLYGRVTVANQPRKPAIVYRLETWRDDAASQAMEIIEAFRDKGYSSGLRLNRPGLDRRGGLRSASALTCG